MKRAQAHPAALITGAAKRIGQAIALELAQAGYDIALHYHKSEKEAKKTQALIRKAGRTCEIFSCDLSREQAIRALMENVKEKFPGLSVLINNSSIFKPTTFSKTTIMELTENFQIHLFSPYLLSQIFSTSWRRGNIINILDRDITKNKTTHVPYLLSKKSLANFTELTALALAPNFRVNAVAPGAVLPPRGKTNDYLTALRKNTPLKRLPLPKDISRAVIFLLQNPSITGQTVFVDAGEHLT